MNSVYTRMLRIIWCACVISRNSHEHSLHKQYSQYSISIRKPDRVQYYLCVCVFTFTYSRNIIIILTQASHFQYNQHYCWLLLHIMITPFHIYYIYERIYKHSGILKIYTHIFNKCMKNSVYIYICMIIVAQCLIVYSICCFEYSELDQWFIKNMLIIIMGGKKINNNVWTTFILRKVKRIYSIWARSPYNYEHIFSQWIINYHIYIDSQNYSNYHTFRWTLIAYTHTHIYIQNISYAHRHTLKYIYENSNTHIYS